MGVWKHQLAPVVSLDEARRRREHADERRAWEHIYGGERRNVARLDRVSASVPNGWRGIRPCLTVVDDHGPEAA